MYTSFGLAFLAACLTASSDARAQQPQDYRGAAHAFALVENRGQWDSQALYRTQRGSAIAWFVRDGFVLDLVGRKQPRSDRSRETGDSGRVQPSPRGEVAGVAIRMSFVGARHTAPSGGQRLPGHFNFFRGADANAWRTEVPSFERLRYPSLYDGIDLAVREGRGLFAYDFHIRAFTDPSNIIVRCEGMESLDITADGFLVLKTRIGEVRQAPPVAWQVLENGEHRPVACRYVKDGDHSFGFAVSSRSNDLPLVIDPDIDWGTYFGDAAWEDCMAISKAPGVSATSLLTVCGPTRSSGFPKTAGPNHQGSMDVFVARFDPSKAGVAQRVWATLIGGDLDELGYDVQQDLLGHATVVGVTQSGSRGSAKAFPTTAKAFQTKFGGGALDGFVSQFDNKGVIVFSTYLGGSGDDRVCKVKINGAFSPTVAGFTDSSQGPATQGFPITANAYQPKNTGGQDAFVTQFRADGRTLTYSTYVGGSGNEGQNYNAGNPAWYDMSTMGFDIDSKGRVLFSARTWSANYPLKNPLQTSLGSANDAFLTILDASQKGAAQLAYSTYLGGAGSDAAENALFEPNRAGVIVASGWTYSRNFTTTQGAFDRVHNGGATHNDTFVTWVDTSKAGNLQLAYSTYLGGSRWDGPSQMEIDSAGVANLGGWCGPLFPTTTSAVFQRPLGNQDGWFARLAPGGNGINDLVYSTYIGGPPAGAGSYVGGVVLDGIGGVFLSGNTAAAPFPTPNGAYRRLVGSRDGFLLHLWGLNEGVRAIGTSTPTVCARSLLLGARGMPVRGNAKFSFNTSGAQANAIGFLGAALPPPTNFQFCQATLYANPLVLLGFRVNGMGELSLPAPIAAATPINTSVLLQFVFANSGCCLTATNGLQVTVLR